MKSFIEMSPDWLESDLQAAQREVWNEGDRFQPAILIVPAVAVPRIKDTFNKIATRHGTNDLFWVGDYGVMAVVTRAQH